MKLPTVIAVLALAGSLLASTYLAFAPVYRSQTCTALPDGRRECRDLGSSTLAEENGSWVLLALAVPPLLSAAGAVSTLPQAEVPWLAGWAVAVVYAVLCVLAIASAGLFFAPSAFLLLVATGWDGYRRSHGA